MSDAKGDAEAQEGKKGGMVKTLAIALVCLAGGGGVGMVLVGPMIAPALAGGAAAEAAASGGGGGDDHGEGAAGAEGEATALHLIDNLVVNPARSGGTRILLTSIAVEPASPEVAARLVAMDVALRSSLIVVLGSKTVDELTDVSMREGISLELFRSLESVVGEGSIHRIFIPQFVVQ